MQHQGGPQMMYAVAQAQPGGQQPVANPRSQSASYFANQRPGGTRVMNPRQPAHNMNTTSNMNSVSVGHSQNQVYPQVMQMMPQYGQIQSVNFQRGPQYNPPFIHSSINNQQPQYMQPTPFQYSPGMYYHPSVIPQPIQQQQSGPSSMSSMAMTSAPPSTSAQPRKKNIITIRDPNTGRDVTDETLAPGSLGGRSSATPPGSASGSSSARATPPENSITPPPTKVESSGDEIAAQFATQVAALVAPKEPQKVIKIEVDSAPPTITTDEQTNVVEQHSISQDTVDASFIQKSEITSTSDDNVVDNDTHADEVCDENVPVVNELTKSISDKSVNIELSVENKDSNIISNSNISSTIEVSSTEKPVNEEIPNENGNRGKKTKGKQRLKGLNEKGKEKEGGEMDAFLDEKESDVFQNSESAVDSKEILTEAISTQPETTTVPELNSSVAVENENNMPSVNSCESENDIVAVKNKENAKVSQLDIENEESEHEENEPPVIVASSVPPKLKYEYKEDQWSPINTEGKKQYDRAFLIQLQSEALSLRKPEGLPDLEVIKDKPVTNSPRNSFDFTPGFVQSTRGRGSTQSTPRRASQQGGRGGSTRRINISINTDIKLHETENAWKPSNFKQKSAVKTEENEIEDIVKAARGILNKLTPQKFDTLVQQIFSLEIDTPNKLSALISLIFDKALDEPSFSVAYANLCKSLIKMKVTTKSGSDVQFRTLLLTNCQNEFEKDSEKEICREQIINEIKGAESEAKKKELMDNLNESERAAKRRTLGNIRFIGELYKLQMLTGHIITDCIQKLLRAGADNDEDSLECLCRLLTTVGKDLEKETMKKNNKPLPKLDPFFNEMQKLVNRKTISSRVRFMMQDVIDLKQNDWIPRREDFNPKTIDEIHKEAAKEAYEQMIQNNAGNSKRMDDRNSRKSRGGGGPTSMSQMANDDGWSTVPGKQRFPDTGKIRQIRSERLDDNNIQLGPGGQGFKMWGYGSSGGNKSNSDASDMKPPAAPSNRFIALITGEPDDIRQNYTARSDPSSRDSSINRQMPNTNSRKISHPRGGSKERKDLLNSVSNLSKNTNMQVQRGSDNSANRKTSRTDSKPAELTQEEMEKKTEHVIDEFLHHCDLEEVILEFKRISSPNTALYFVSSSINQILERSDKARNQIGHLLHNLVKKKVLSMQQYIDGLKEILQCADDLVVDIPRFWVYIGEIIAPMIHNDSASLSFLVDVAQPLTEINKAGKLVAEVLHASSKALGPVMLRNLWNKSGLEWSSFVKSDRINEFIEENKLHFMIQQSETPQLNIENVKRKLDSLLLQRSADNDEIMDWFDGNIGNVNAENPLFIRALMTAVCESAIKGEGTSSILDKEVFKQRTPLLQKYLDNKEKLELHALYALQRLLHRLEHPLGVVRSIFDLLYDEEVISEDAFSQWENNKDPAEQEGHAVLMKSLTMFFTWLREPEEPEEQLDDPAK